MLTSDTAWMSDGYKPKLIQSEKNDEEVKAVVKSERKISFSNGLQSRSRPISAVIRRPSTAPKYYSPNHVTSSAVKISSRPVSAKQTRSTRTRVQSAPPRSQRRSSTTITKIPTGHKNNASNDEYTRMDSIGQVAKATFECTQNSVQPPPPTVSHTETTTTVFASSTNSQTPDPNVVSFHSQQIVTRTIDNAAFRQKCFSSTSNAPRPRPSSGRITPVRPLGQPRSAWSSNNEIYYHNGRPNTPQLESNPDFTLYPNSHDLDNTSVSLAASEDVVNNTSLRVTNDTTHNRPQSSCSHIYQRTNEVDTISRRAQSACSMRSKSPSHFYSKASTREDLVSPWMDDPRIGLNVGFDHDPALLYFDRHSRCHNHNHLHHPVLLWRPQPACTETLENCSHFDVSGSRPVSAMSMRSQTSQPERVQRYIDSHRPRTAPFTRKDQQKHGAPGEHKSGYMPHYCNFVRSKAIHDRPKGGPNDLLGSMDDLGREEDIDDGYITNTEASPTGNDAARKKSMKSRSGKTTSKGKKSKGGLDDADGRSKGGILRVSSPTASTGYDPESLFERLRDQGLAGSNSALNDSNSIDDDILGSPHVNFDLSDVINKDFTHDVTTQTSSLSRSSTPAREPIQIPSIEENSNDIVSTAVGDYGKNVNQFANKSSIDQDVNGATNQKFKRTPCAKKDKMPGKERKKKGKKKSKSEDHNDTVIPSEITQVSEQTQKEAPTLENGADPRVDVLIPDLPTVKTPSREQGGKAARRKNKKLIGAPTKKAEKTDTTTATTTADPGKGFYDFGDLSSVNNSYMEDRTLSKATVKVPSYLNDRMVLSLQSSRFELPMDMKSLEVMSPREYLKKHCKVSTRRKTLYQKIFIKYREKGGCIPGKQLARCLMDVLVNTISPSQVAELCNLLDVEDVTQIDFPFFCGIAALAERILYPHFLTEDTADCTEYQKERVEVADFCSLDWKLDGVNVSNNIKQLLQAIS